MNGKTHSHDEDELRIIKRQESEERKAEKQEYLERLWSHLEEEERQKQRRPTRTNWKIGD